jgi:hypothetical protein
VLIGLGAAGAVAFGVGLLFSDFGHGPIVRVSSQRAWSSRRVASVRVEPSRGGMVLSW